MEINLKNDIIILDEAHNIEDAAREGASEHFTDDQLDKTFKEIHEMSKVNTTLFIDITVKYVISSRPEIQSYV